MNKRIDLSNLGGFPMTQFTLSEMQDSYRGAFAAMAKLVGDKTILYGVDVIGSNVTAGWIAYNGELIPFMPGAFNTKVVIIETAVPRTFEDTTIHDAYFTKTATCALLGDFDFTDLVRLPSFSNIWLPGDLKQKYVDNTYIAANFDIDGFGLLREKGWRILSSVIAAASGKVLVNIDPADPVLDTAGNYGGLKSHTLSGAEQGSIKIKGKIDDVSGGGTTVMADITINGTLAPKNGGANQGSDGSEVTIRLNEDAASHSIMQPYFAVLTLIKL